MFSKLKFVETQILFNLHPLNNRCHVNSNFIDCNILKIKFSSKIPVKIPRNPEQAA